MRLEDRGKGPQGPGSRRRAAGRGTRVLRVVVLALALSPVSLASPVAGSERWEALGALPRVALEVVVSPQHADLRDAAARARVTAALARTQPAPTLDPASPDRLRLTIAVRTLSSDDLRGYALPFSQQYGIGPVRLSLERQVTIDGLAAPVPAVVWQSERLATRPMARSASEILGLVDEMMAVFLSDYRRALGQ
jgi:hypothetical protein